MAADAVRDRRVCVAEQNLRHDPEGQGWYGWVLLANEGERAPPRLVGIAALIGRPDEDGDVEHLWSAAGVSWTRLWRQTIRTLATGVSPTAQSA